MDAIQPLRDFFDRQLSESEEVYRQPGVEQTVSREQIIQHLVERTLRRASLDAATQRSLDGGKGKDVSWKHCLMVAALTELRPLRLQARPHI